MDISKEELLRVNGGFGGNLRNDSSLDYALEQQKNNKLSSCSKLAYLIRAIVVDHTFSDGNKRTAMYLAFLFADENNKLVDIDLLTHHLLSIAKNNESNIRNISIRLKTCIK